MVNCAVWARYWFGSDGFMGFWFLSSATSNFKNVLGSLKLLLATVGVGGGLFVGRGLPGGMVVVMGVVSSQVQVDTGAGRGPQDGDGWGEKSVVAGHHGRRSG